MSLFFSHTHRRPLGIALLGAALTDASALTVIAVFAFLVLVLAAALAAVPVSRKDLMKKVKGR